MFWVCASDLGRLLYLGPEKLPTSLPTSRLMKRVAMSETIRAGVARQFVTSLLASSLVTCRCRWRMQLEDSRFEAVAPARGASIGHGRNAGPVIGCCDVSDVSP